jgi:hypothetical protein
LSKALQELEARRELGHIDQRRIDEARAIARRYRKTHDTCHLKDTRKSVREFRCALCIETDALPWAKDD